MQPSDIADYNLPSDHLTEQDVNALKAELADPRIATDYWRNQINLQLEMQLKSERQVFANQGLDFVTKEYLPTRLSEMGVIRGRGPGASWRCLTLLFSPAKGSFACSNAGWDSLTFSRVSARSPKEATDRVRMRACATP